VRFLVTGRDSGTSFTRSFGAGKLDCVDFQSVPTDEAQGVGYGFGGWMRLGPRRKQTQARGPNADAKMKTATGFEETNIHFVPAKRMRHGGKAGQHSH